MKRLLCSILAICIMLSAAVFTVAEDTSYPNVNLSLTSQTETVTVDLSFTADAEYAGKSYNLFLAFYNEAGTVITTRCLLSQKVAEGENTRSIIEEIPDDAVTAKAFCWSAAMEPIASKEIEITQLKTIRILAIGNSFSIDAMQYLYKVLSDCGYEKIILGNLYIGGCSLEKHWNNANNNNASYTYYKNTADTWVSTPSQTMLTAIKDEKWDIITMQQASGSSGVASAYEPYLSNLITYVHENKTNPAAKLAWHMTWAYQQDSTHSDFSKYSKDQMTMYNAIVNAVNTKVIPTGEFDYIIPAGTAIQNVRTSYIGDVLTRDGYHLSKNLGRYTAALTWAKVLCGADIDSLTYTPSKTEVNANVQLVAKEAVNNAAKTPFSVTQSSYTVDPDASEATPTPEATPSPTTPPVSGDLEGYTLIDWEPVGSAYYNSSTGSSTRLYTTANNSPNFIASRLFTKQELPVGSIIEVDSGFQYRPEGWIDPTVKNDSSVSRPDNVKTAQVVVDEAWWGDFTVRGFNISSTTYNTDISARVDEIKNYFRIYVPIAQ